jgi:acyl-CoA thioesterase-1
VLLIGDSIALEYAEQVQDQLAGLAWVGIIPENGLDTATSRRRLEAWLGSEQWALIHFNWGLHDLRREIVDGEVTDTQVPIDEYVENLHALLDVLEATGATLIFATTTPVQAVAAPQRKPQDVRDYNSAAQAVMAERGVVVNDLHATAVAEKAVQDIDGVHFLGPGSHVLAKAVAASIRKAIPRAQQK